MTALTEDTQQLPFASSELEGRAEEIFPVEMTPEEFAGRDGEGWEAFPFANYQYHNAALNTWIHQFAKIINTPGLVEVYQMKYLTLQERARLATLKEVIEDDL